MNSQQPFLSDVQTLRDRVDMLGRENAVLRARLEHEADAAGQTVR